MDIETVIISLYFQQSVKASLIKSDFTSHSVHCVLKEVDERVIRDHSVWQPAGRFKRKIGPVPECQGENNQTVFIRGITITPNPSGAGQSERQTGLLRVLSAPTQFLSTMVGSSTTATATETPKSNVIIQHVPQVSQVNSVVYATLT